MSSKNTSSVAARILKFLKTGADITERQAQSRFGIVNVRARMSEGGLRDLPEREGDREWTDHQGVSPWYADEADDRCGQRSDVGPELRPRAGVCAGERGPLWRLRLAAASRRSELTSPTFMTP